MTDPARSRMARVLGLEVALLEAEVALAADLVAEGFMPPDARRQPTSRELRASVRFAELDRIVTETAALISRRAERVSDKVLDGLAEARDAVGADPWEAVEDLARLANPADPATLPGLADAMAEVEAEVVTDLEQAARRAADEARAEARRQGIGEAVISDRDPVDADLTAAARAHAAQVARTPAGRLLNVAAEAGARAATVSGATGHDVVSAAVDAARGASRAAVDDAARQAANVAHGLGRAAAQADLPEPAEVYASELLDRNTCGPCAEVDGRTYDSMADALVDYPGAGGYVGCDGGSRCRGTLVLVHATEASPTRPLPTPPPRGPSGRSRPDHVGEDGSILPPTP